MKTDLIRGFLFLGSVTLATSGCQISSSADDDAGDTDAADDSSGSDDGPPAQENVELDDCKGDNDVEDNIVIVGDYDQSIHEMVACGGLNLTLVAAITTGIVEAVIDNRSDATPDDWEYQGEGTYYTNGAMAEMTTQFFLAEDFEFGSAGDVLTENLFDVRTYLVGARVEAEFDINDPLSTSAELHFDGVGPYVELLGFGPDPQSPIAVDLSTWDDIQDALGNIEFDSDIQVDDTQSRSTVRYHVTTSRMPASGLLNGNAMGYDLQMADATRGDISQTLVVDNWGIDFVSGGSGALDGQIDFRVEGGSFGYEGALIYEESTFGIPQLRCPQ